MIPSEAPNLLFRPYLAVTQTQLPCDSVITFNCLCVSVSCLDFGWDHLSADAAHQH